MMSLVRNPLALALAAALTLAACSEAPPPAPTAAPAEPAPAPVAEPAAPSEPAITVAPALQAALANAARSPENAARDAWRNPGETLSFFGIAPELTVIEITPGGGWYAEILAPYLRDSGRYVAAVVDPASASSDNARDYYAKSNDALRAKFTATPAAYDKGSVVEFNPASPAFGEPGSADLVLTFRNVHNWIGNGSAQAMFDGFFAALKPGGVLGVVEHRANADVPADDRSGYLSENQVIGFATAAGFRLESSSEINANPADTKNHPNGVWTLPPSLRVPDGTDAQPFRDIGESDRMTLKFVKPAGDSSASSASSSSAASTSSAASSDAASDSSSSAAAASGG